MITVHHLNNSRSQRVIWLLEELEIPYKIEFYKRDPVTMLAPSSLKNIHPLGKSPVITDTESDRAIAESAVIVEYIIKKYGQGKFIPELYDPLYWEYLYWMHYSEGSLMSPLLLSLIFQKIKNAPVPFFIKPIARKIADSVMTSFVTPNLVNHANFIEAQLAGKQWLCGDILTGADFQMSYPLEAALDRSAVNEKDHPNTVAYIKRFQARPAYQRALSKVGESR